MGNSMDTFDHTFSTMDIVIDDVQETGSPDPNDRLLIIALMVGISLAVGVGAAGMWIYFRTSRVDKDPE